MNSRLVHMSSFILKGPATTGISTLSLHDALPISERALRRRGQEPRGGAEDASGKEQARLGRAAEPVDGRPPARRCARRSVARDRKSTRLNSSHTVISYAVFCLKKKRGNRPANFVD